MGNKEINKYSAKLIILADIEANFIVRQPTSKIKIIIIHHDACGFFINTMHVGLFFNPL